MREWKYLIGRDFFLPEIDFGATSYLRTMIFGPDTSLSLRKMTFYTVFSAFWLEPLKKPRARVEIFKRRQISTPDSVSWTPVTYLKNYGAL